MGEYHLQRHPRPFHAGFYYVIHLLEMHKKKRVFAVLLVSDSRNLILSDGLAYRRS